MTTIDFVVNELYTGVTCDLATIAGTGVNFDSNYHATAVVDIPLANLATVFQFWTDAVDVTSVPADDLKFRYVHDKDATPYVMLGGNFSLDTQCFIQEDNGESGETSDINQMYVQSFEAGTNTVTYDFVRFLAKKLFGTINGVDLFDNEAALRTSLNSMFISNFNTKTSNLTRAVTNTSDADKSIADTIFQQMTYTERGKDRLTNISPVTGETNWYSVPLIAGDSLSFILKITPATDQHTLTSASSIPTHSYRIKFNIVP